MPSLLSRVIKFQGQDKDIVHQELGTVGYK